MDAVSADDPAAVQAAAPVITHDDRCEAEYIGPAGSLTDCGCAERAAHPVITMPGSTENIAGAPDLTRVIADRLTGNELLPGAWVILDATPVDDVIVLRVVTWGPSVETSARTEARYVLRLVQENPPTP